MMDSPIWFSSGAGGGGGIPTDNLLHHFNFDDYSGSTVTNLGTGGDGTLTNATIDTGTTLAGHNTMLCATTATTTVYGLEIGSSNTFDMTTAHTVSLWFYRPVNWNVNANKYTSLFTKGSVFIDNDSSVHFYERGLSSDLRFQGPYGNTSGGTNSTYANAWYHFVGVNRPGGTNSMYVDGVEVSTNTPITYTSSSYNMRLGYDYNIEQSWRGNIGLFRFYSRELTLDEIAALYAEVP